VGILALPQETSVCSGLRIHDVVGEGVVILIRLFACKTGSIVEDVIVSNCSVINSSLHGFAIDDNGQGASLRNITFENCNVTNVLAMNPGLGLRDFW